MTKEQLEELIKQEEWVWLIDDEQTIGLESSNKFHIFGLKLSNKFHVKDNSLRSEVETVYATLNNIFETKDRAEWALKTTAERTERFEPPMWEDMQKILQQEPYYNFVFVKNNSVYEFVVSDKLGVRNYDCIDLDKCLFFGNSTKENYIKACEIVRDLFNKGGAKC